METEIYSHLAWLIPFIIIATIWESVWRIIAMWKSARANHFGWFICIALLNTLGILPIIYIVRHKNK